jgi:hypothetical protein
MLIRTSRSCSKLKPNTPSFNSFSFAQEIGSNRRLLLYAFFQPVQIFLRSTCNGNHQELRHVIAMQALQLPLQLRHPSRSRFDNEQHFSRRFHLSLPSVDALDRSRHNIHAGRQSLFQQPPCQPFSLRERSAVRQNQPHFLLCTHFVFIS